jgi:hypothetical protein
MADCTAGDTKTENGIVYICIGGKWVPLPPTIHTGPGPAATVIVDTRDELDVALASKEIREALDSPHSRLVISVIPQTPDGG